MMIGNYERWRPCSRGQSVNSRISLIISLTAVRLDQDNERRDGQSQPVTGEGLVVTVEQDGNTRLTMQIEEHSATNQPPGVSLSIQKMAKISSHRYQYETILHTLKSLGISTCRPQPLPSYR